MGLTKGEKTKLGHALRYSVLPNGATLRPLCPSCSGPIPPGLMVPEEVRKQAAASGITRLPLPARAEVDCPSCGETVEITSGTISVYGTKLARRVKLVTTTLQ